MLIPKNAIGLAGIIVDEMRGPTPHTGNYELETKHGNQLRAKANGCNLRLCQELGHASSDAEDIQGILKLKRHEMIISQINELILS